MSDLEPEIRESIKRYGAKIFGVIQRQVPQPNNTPHNPYATGRLKNSLRWSVNQDGTISIRFFRYGITTDRGAGQYKVGVFDPFTTAFRGYAKGGFYGIQPQYWTALGGEEARNALQTFEQELADEIEIWLATTTTRNIQAL